MVQSSQGGHGISEKEGPEGTASGSQSTSYLSLISISELAISLVGKAHVIKMKLNLNFSH